MVGKNAQLKIQQMAFVLMAVTLFFVLAGMFVLVFVFSGMKGSAEDTCQKNALLLVTGLANSPEFSCGDAYGSRMGSCIDADKVMILKENIEKYGNFWGVESIEIRKIVPAGDKVECELSNYPDCNSISVKDSDNPGYVEENFVILCGKRIKDGQKYDKCEIAKLMLGAKEKQC